MDSGLFGTFSSPAQQPPAVASASIPTDVYRAWSCPVSLTEASAVGRDLASQGHPSGKVSHLQSLQTQQESLLGHPQEGLREPDS